LFQLRQQRHSLLDANRQPLVSACP
jgi:hypothetical protein